MDFKSKISLKMDELIESAKKYKNEMKGSRIP
jgi:hypothetical protein